jgi:acetyl-CoA C-acetyltransferase
VNFAQDSLGLAEDDPRGVTQTGGLPYHGGPGSNYMTHSIAAMVETLRADPGSFGVTSGVGMHMQKHAYGVWSTTPAGPASAARADVPPTETAAAAAPAIVESPEGSATVATYSVLHGRDGNPESALLVCDLPHGARCYAKLESADGELGALGEAETDELIGRQVTLHPKDGINWAHVV